MSSSEEEITLTPNTLMARNAKNVVEQILPPKSKQIYLTTYEMRCVLWRAEKQVNSSESVFLTYFDELSKKLKPSTLWSVYSMLKSTLQMKNDVHIKTYVKLTCYVLQKAFHWAQKCKSHGLHCETNRNILKHRYGYKIFGYKNLHVNGMELHAAEALLQLHCGTRRATLEIEGAATLFLNCLPTHETPSPAAFPSQAVKLETSRHRSVISRDDNSESSFDSPVSYSKHKYAQKYRHLEAANTRREVEHTKKSAKTKRAPNRNLFNGHESQHQPINSIKKNTCEQGTQTDEVELYQMATEPELKKMKALISNLYAEIRELEAQLRATQRRSHSPLVGELDPDVTSDVLQIHNQQNNVLHKRKVKRSSSSYNTANTATTDASDDEWKPQGYKPSKHIINEMLKPKGNNMVPIGDGYASVPARVLKQIDWSSYTCATRKLLTAVFSRRVLATHSLTGKPSPAFPGKPAKKQLNPNLVNDIVQVVVEHCRVPESVVRTSITTKCADESKMFRSRQESKKKQNSIKTGQENVPPSNYAESSDDTL